MIDNLAKLLKVKSIVTLAMTAFMGFLLSGLWNPPTGITELYCTAYGAIITYFFTKKDGDQDGSAESD